MLMGRWVVIRRGRRRRFCSRELPRPVRYEAHVWKTIHYQVGAFLAAELVWEGNIAGKMWKSGNGRIAK